MLESAKEGEIKADTLPEGVEKRKNHFVQDKSEDEVKDSKVGSDTNHNFKERNSEDGRSKSEVPEDVLKNVLGID